MSEFSAAPQFLGYLHQVRYALVVLLENESASLRLEALDDIELHTAADATELIQLKLRAEGTALTDADSDFWKTLRVWSTAVWDGSVAVERTIFSLVTTASAASESAAARLRPGADRAPSLAHEALSRVADTSANAKLQPAFEAFRRLDPDTRQRMVSRIYVFDRGPEIEDSRVQLERRLAPTTRREHRTALADRLEGWWLGKCVEMLRGRVADVSGFEVFDRAADLAAELRADSLPIDYGGAEPTIDELALLEKRQFVLQLECLNVNSGRVKNAILDYYRAYVQRSRWVRDRLLFGDEMEKYEGKLVNEWERLRLMLEDELVPTASEEELIKLGRRLLAWAETEADIRIRPAVNEAYVMRGSFHILADPAPPRVWWHPQFLARLSKLLVAGGA
jgi:hypothetical protein